jgi:hypothetical protein
MKDTLPEAQDTYFVIYIPQSIWPQLSARMVMGFLQDFIVRGLNDAMLETLGCSPLIRSLNQK